MAKKADEDQQHDIRHLNLEITSSQANNPTINYQQ